MYVAKSVLGLLDITFRRCHDVRAQTVLLFDELELLAEKTSEVGCNI